MDKLTVVWGDGEPTCSLERPPIFHEGKLRVYANTQAKPLAIRLWQDGCRTALLEGRVYGVSEADLEKRLLKLCSADSAAELRNAITDFALNEDGEFNVLLSDGASGRWFLFSDFLGRLPLFQASRNELTVIGRSLRDVARLSGCTRLDEIGVACRLLLGYPFDSTTEFKNVSSLPEGVLLSCDGVNAPSAIQVAPLNLDTLEYSSRSWSEMPDLIVAACRRRIRDEKPLLALSGGFDSRVVASALVNVAPEFDVATRKGKTSNAEDVRFAAEVADTIGRPLTLHDISQLDHEDVVLNARNSDGALSIELSHMLSFLFSVRASLGEGYILFTGDGGDKTLAPLLPSRRIRNNDAVVRLLLEDTTQADLAMCERLLSVGASAIRDYLHNCVEKTPERSPANKLRGLTIRQRGRRWLFAGEDRNRLVFWSTSPFWSPEYFRKVLGIPDKEKSGRRLYFSVLNSLNPAAAVIRREGYDIRNPIHRATIFGYRQISKSRALLSLYRRLKGSDRRLSTTGPAAAIQEELVSRFLSDSHPLLQLLEPPQTREWLQQALGSRLLSRTVSLAIALSDL